MRIIATTLLLAVPFVFAENALSAAHLAGLSAEAESIARAIREHASGDAPASVSSTSPISPANAETLREKIHSAMLEAQRKMHETQGHEAKAERMRMLMERIRAMQAHRAPVAGRPLAVSLSDTQRRSPFSLIFQRPNMFFEVVRVDRKIAVDAQNHPTAVIGAEVHKALYRLQSGRLQRIAAIDTVMRPRSAQNAGAFAADGRTPIDRMKADVALSLLLGLTMTTILFAAAYVAARLYERNKTESYDAVMREPAIVAHKDPAADGLLSREERRLESSLPALPL